MPPKPGRPTLVTDRLRLRAPRRADAPRIAALAADLDVARMTASIPHPLTLDHAEAFIDGVERSEGATFALETPDDGLLGVLAVEPNPEGAAEIGFWLGRPFWGRGYMTEATRAGLAWTADALGRRFVMAGHFADNPASGRVLIKAGFLYTGDVEPRYSLARGEAAPTRRMVWLA